MLTLTLHAATASIPQTTLHPITNPYRPTGPPVTVPAPACLLPCTPSSLWNANLVRVCVCVCDSGGARLAVWAAECFQTVESVTDTPGRAISGALMSSADHSAHTHTRARSYTHMNFANIMRTHLHNGVSGLNYHCDNVWIIFCTYCMKTLTQ